MCGGYVRLGQPRTRDGVVRLVRIIIIYFKIQISSSSRALITISKQNINLTVNTQFISNLPKCTTYGHNILVYMINNYKNLTYIAGL